MKNLFLTTAAALFLLTACSKDESFETVEIENQTNEKVYVLDQSKAESNFTPLNSVNNSEGGVNFSRRTDNSEYGFTSGLYQPLYMDPTSLSWSGSRDESGSFGTVELQINRTNYNIHIVLEAECISVDGDTAMYGATIIDVIEVSGDTPPLTVMWRMYFQVKDNDNGNGIGFDQISNTLIFASPRSVSLCNIYPPKHGVWNTNGHANVQSPGFVEVSNNPQ